MLRTTDGIDGIVAPRADINAVSSVGTDALTPICLTATPLHRACLPFPVGAHPWRPRCSFCSSPRVCISASSEHCASQSEHRGREPPYRRSMDHRGTPPWMSPSPSCPLAQPGPGLADSGAPAISTAAAQAGAAAAHKTRAFSSRTSPTTSPSGTARPTRASPNSSAFAHTAAANPGRTVGPHRTPEKRPFSHRVWDESKSVGPKPGKAPGALPTKPRPAKPAKRAGDCNRMAPARCPNKARAPQPPPPDRAPIAATWTGPNGAPPSPTAVRRWTGALPRPSRAPRGAPQTTSTRSTSPLSSFNPWWIPPRPKAPKGREMASAQAALAAANAAATVPGEAPFKAAKDLTRAPIPTALNTAGGT